MHSTNLTGQFLIAMPAMADPYFAHSLVFLCEHNENGALGLICNRPLDMTLSQLFEKVDLSLSNDELGGQPVFFGGPVQTDRGFVLHRRLPEGSPEWQSHLIVNDAIQLTSSRDILQAISRGEAPHQVLISLGYAGWSAGQLEEELMANAWLTVDGDESILFDLPHEERLPAAMQRLGIDFSSLSDVAGHA